MRQGVRGAAPSRSTSFSCAASSRDVPTAAVAGISSPSSMKKKFTVSAGSAGGGASLGVHSARIAGNERIAAGRLARCRSIVAANRTGGCGDLVPLAVPKTCSGENHGTCCRDRHAVHSWRNRAISGRALRSLICGDLCLIRSLAPRATSALRSRHRLNPLGTSPGLRTPSRR